MLICMSYFVSVTFNFYVFSCLFFYYCVKRPEDLHRIRVEHMERQLANLTIERQLANLTGLVQKALHQTGPPTSNINQNYLGVPGQYRGKFMHFQLNFVPIFFCFCLYFIQPHHNPQNYDFMEEQCQKN